MRAEYDFRGRVRGKHYRAMQAGYSVTVHKADGTILIKDILPKEGAVILELDIHAYFPDSECVNRT
jgi:ribulose-5-phosphate 4-epimerase/fuculose-1-phosphate aldolase